MKTIFILFLCLTLTYCAIIKREADENEEKPGSDPEVIEGKDAEENDNKEEEVRGIEKEDKDKDEGENETAGEENEMKESEAGENEEKEEKQTPESGNKGGDCEKESEDMNDEAVVYFVPVPIEMVDTVYDVYSV